MQASGTRSRSYGPRQKVVETVSCCTELRPRDALPTCVLQPRAFGGHANDRVAAVAASVAASKLPLAAAISSVNQQVGGMSKCAPLSLLPCTAHAHMLRAWGRLTPTPALAGLL